MYKKDEIQNKLIHYGSWEIHPELMQITQFKAAESAIWDRKSTKYEGNILYRKHWNFWVRAGVAADLRSVSFFRDYERGNVDSTALLNDIGFPWRKAETEEEVWSRIGTVWNWLRNNVRVNNDEYNTISSVDGEWPSILDYARYFTLHGNLVWAACFSKAHVFAGLLGRMVYPRYRFAIAEAHHTENGAPPTATHVYIAVYVSDRWFYLDPTAVTFTDFPEYRERRSIGVNSFDTVDYQHPYKIIPLPLSGFEEVPYLPV